MEHLPTGKAPGPNGVPNAVYKYLSHHFAPKFAEMANQIIEKKKMPKHMLEGIICQIYKKNDREDPRNYRPITLLNTDYKIFTRILAKRMKNVVHEIISSTQKGFVPRELIQDCTMLLHLIEAYINEEPEERKGIFIFFDMEKAFDRVSYEFINKAMHATGFGPNFRTAVQLMYDENKAPKRRILTNGYLSDWFEIKSGVAQGCPLSPLLFLLVAEGLKRTIEHDKRIRGIKIGDKRYGISQFADDTTLILDGLKGYKPAMQAVRRWGKATGMKENIAKREGLAMGKYRLRQMPCDTKWIPEHGWAKSLGNPVGNDLDHSKFWEKKIEAVRTKAKQWVGLYRSSYRGRNLIVQTMYFGSMRYWLYTLVMNKTIKRKIQTDADTLWWNPDPDLENIPTRIKRWIRKETAIGDQSRGGANNLDWTIHSEGFTSEWFIRYAHPTKAHWKEIIEYMLFADKQTNEISNEKDSMIYANLSQTQKLKLLHKLPKKAKYIRQALQDFWKLKLVPADDTAKRTYASESLWYNHDFEININWRDRKYYQEILDVNIISDIIDADTDKPFTRMDWREWIEQLHEEKLGKKPDNTHIIEKADLIYETTKKIPRRIIRSLRTYLGKRTRG